MTLPKIPLHPDEDPAPDTTRVQVIGTDARRRLIQEAANQHYQDQPMVTAGLSGGVLGAVLGGAGLPLLTSILQDKPMYSGMSSRDVMSASLAGGGLGAVAGLGNEALGRILTRMAGPSFEPRRWARDQDPHRFNSALKVAPLGLSVLASRLLVPHLMKKEADVRPKKKDRSKPPASSWGWGAGVLGLGALGALAATTARNQPWSHPPWKSVSASSPGKTVTGKRMTNLQALLTSVGITGAAGLAGNTAVRANLDRIGALSSQSSPFLHTLAGKIRGELPNLAEKGRIRTPDIVVPKASQSAFIHNTATVTSPSGFSYNQPGWALRAPTNLHPSILAHEAGHAQRGLARGMYMNAVPGALGTLLGGAGLFTKDENTSLALSAVPTALQSVRLVDELAASRAGANLVRSFAPVGMSAPAVRQVARGAYGGVPSYALQATLPLATHYLRKYLGGFEQSAAP